MTFLYGPEKKKNLSLWDVAIFGDTRFVCFILFFFLPDYRDKRVL